MGPEVGGKGGGLMYSIQDQHVLLVPISQGNTSYNYVTSCITLSAAVISPRSVVLL